MTSLLYCGITQDRVPVGIRERIQADAPRRRRLAALAQPLAGRLLVLSTCERFELYADAREGSPRAWTALLAREFGFSLDALAPHLCFRAGEAAAEHLLRVSAGLESRLLGEPHILRQVRAAYLDGLTHRELGATLSALGRAAIHAGKCIRRETALASAGNCVVSLALDRLLPRTAPRAGLRHVVVLGTGMLAREALHRLRRQSDLRITLLSRSDVRAAELASRYGIDAAPLRMLPLLLRRADALLACSAAADGFLVHRRSIRRRREHPLQLVDLGLPRNIDPDAGSLPGVNLVALEQLHAFDTASPEAIRAAEAIVARELQRFAAWRRGHVQSADIAALAADADCDRRSRHARIARLKAQVAA